MDLLEAVLLGMIQGLTEWLPISSSGHLVVAQHFMEPPPLVFDVMLHFGTVLVLIHYFRGDLGNMGRALGRSLGNREGATFREIVRKDPDVRMAWFVVVGMVPTGLVGIVLELTVIDILYSSLEIVGICLLLTGVILILTVRVRGKRRIRDMKNYDAILVGLAQGLAIFPGISRSGATIGIGILRGVEAQTAGRFGFILAIPAILGATVLYIPDLFSGGVEIDLLAFGVGTVVAMIVGYASLALLMRILKGKGFHRFAYYCWAFGTLVLVAGLMGY